MNSDLDNLMGDLDKMQSPILQSMLGDETFQQFLKSWPEKCFSAHGPLNRLPAPLSDEILTSIEALTEKYQGSLQEFDPARDASRLYRVLEGTAVEVIKKGTTAYLNDVAPLLTNAGEFKSMLEQELYIRPGSAKLTVFISAAGTGAPVHYDALDVISVQLVGRKKFFTSPLQQIRFPYGRQYSEGGPGFTALYPQISKGYPSCKNQDFEQIEMQPGSVLFMPRGTWHYTEAEQDSMAMSIVLSPHTQVDYFLSQLKTTLLQDPAWRAPCYGLGDREISDVKLYSNLSNTIYKLTKAHRNPESPIRSFQKNSRFLRNPGVEAKVVSGEYTCQVEYPQVSEEGVTGMVKMDLPSEIAGVFHWFMCQEGPFTIADCMKSFPSVRDEDLTQLFLSAEKSGFLVKLWFVEL